MKDDLKCPICGEPTSACKYNVRKDRLCRKHATEFKNGEIVQCEKCGTWHKTNVKCKCEETNKEEKKTCVTCGKESNGYPQCRDCYYETKSFMDSFDKNSTVRQFRDHYYNLKERIIIINDYEEAKKQCNRLIAIAMTNENVNEDTSLTDRVYNDVLSLLAPKKKIPQTFFKEKHEEKEKAKINTAQDGHNTDSDMEVRIDDILYNNFILHAYGKNITEITEKRKKCDWFVPISNGKGIYIEYWGMNTPDYLAERKEKEELYHKYNIPYIGIEKDDPKQDTQTFTNNLLRDLRTKAIDAYCFMPEWKK